jgi:hypothetical protein
VLSGPKKLDKMNKAARASLKNFPVVLQKLIEDRRCVSIGAGYATALKIWSMKFT